jgi:hypothetical protein
VVQVRRSGNSASAVEDLVVAAEAAVAEDLFLALVGAAAVEVIKNEYL